MAVGHGVGKAVGPRIVNVRGVGKTALAIHHHGTVVGQFQHAVSQHVGIRINVIARHRAVKHLVFEKGECFALGHRHILRVGDGEVHRRSVVATVAIGEGVGEAVAAEVVERGRVNQIVIDAGHGSVGGLCEAGDVERVVVGVGVIGHDVDGDGNFFIGGRAVGDGDRRILNGVNREVDRRGVGSAKAIGQGVGKAITAEMVDRGGVDKVVRDAGDGAVCGLREAVDVDQVAVGVAVVGHHIDGDGRFFIGSRTVRNGNGIDVGAKNILNQNVECVTDGVRAIGHVYAEAQRLVAGRDRRGEGRRGGMGIAKRDRRPSGLGPGGKSAHRHPHRKR